MPMTRRGASELLDAIDHHGEAVTRTGLTLRTALMDGVLDETELVAIDRCLDEMTATYQQVGHDGMAIDQALVLIRGLAHAGDITAPQIQRSFREFTQDRQRLDGLIAAESTGEMASVAD